MVRDLGLECLGTSNPDFCCCSIGKREGVLILVMFLENMLNKVLKLSQYCKKPGKSDGNRLVQDFSEENLLIKEITCEREVGIGSWMSRGGWEVVEDCRAGVCRNLLTKEPHCRNSGKEAEILLAVLSQRFCMALGRSNGLLILEQSMLYSAVGIVICLNLPSVLESTVIRDLALEL